MGLLPQTENRDEVQSLVESGHDTPAKGICYFKVQRHAKKIHRVCRFLGCSIL